MNISCLPTICLTKMTLFWPSQQSAVNMTFTLKKETEVQGGENNGLTSYLARDWTRTQTQICLCLKTRVCVCVCVCVCTHACALLCPTLCNPMVCSPPSSSVYGIFQARILEWVAIFFSRASSWPRDWNYVSCISCIGRWILCQQCHLGSPYETWYSSNSLYRSKNLDFS